MEKQSMIPKRLLDGLQLGKVVLLTGAGMSVGSKNRFGNDIISASALSKVVAERAGLPYKDEPIRRVFNAARPKIGDHGLSEILRDNFTSCLPSSHLQEFLRFTWKRLYTFNIDDTLINTNIHRRRQHLNIFNGLTSRREEWRDYRNLQAIFLHGRADDLEAGIIFSEADYASNSAFQRPWYVKLGEDYSEFILLMIGSSLDEPIFRQHVATFRPSSGFTGTSYLVTPSELSAIDHASLEEEGIEHIRATAEQFIREVLRQFPTGITPEDVLRATSLPNDGTTSVTDLENLKSFIPISAEGLNRFASQNEHDVTRYRRLFYEGFGPNWYVVTRGEIATLSSFEENEKQVLDQIDTNPLVAISGEAGSGKSTFLHWLALRLATKHDRIVYLYQPRQALLLDSIHSLSSYLKHERAIVLIDDLSIYVREIKEIVSDGRLRNITIVTSVRSGEWASRVRMHLADRVSPIEMPRFKPADVPLLITKIDQFYPAPQFSRLPYLNKVERFERSRKQLLIALKEATYGLGFDEIIDNEVDGIKDRMTRVGLCLACVCTMPRTGISFASAASVLRSINPSFKLPQIITNLDGIIEVDQNNRVKARHEIYARQVVERHVTMDEYEEILLSMIAYFAQYKMPVIKNVTQTDGQLFKYLLNNKNIYDGFKRYDQEDRSTRIFERFEVELQQDGHFWLQYGLLLRRLRRQREALEKLRKSLEAYPGNRFAEHALAQQKMMVATYTRRFDAAHERLVAEAVDTLLAMHSSSAASTQEVFDNYPITTLAYSHVNLLMRHDRKEEAISEAKGYFALTESVRGRRMTEIDELRRDLAQLVTQGRWVKLELAKGSVELERPSSKRRRAR